MKRIKYVHNLLVLVVVFLMVSAGAALADEAGWNQDEKNIWYCEEGEEGLVRVTGLQKIGKKNYYLFDEAGNLLTGWQKTADGNRFFSKTGNASKRGRMYTGLKKIGKKYFYFNENKDTPKKYGVVSAGFTQVKDDFYYFTKGKVLGTRGAAYTNRWITIKGEKRYFGKDGKMYRNVWVDNTYYVTDDGAILKNAITPDGYVVDEKGRRKGEKLTSSGWVEVSGNYQYYSVKKNDVVKKKWIKANGLTYYVHEDGNRAAGLTEINGKKYYFDESNGEMKTGPVKIDGKYYLFAENGKLAVNQKSGQYPTDKNGMITSDTSALDKKVLVLAGHGQGDSGAVSVLGQEYLLTRQFAKLLYEQLKTNGHVTVEYLKDGSTDYDLFQRHKAVLGSFRDSVTGNGALKAQLQAKLKAAGTLPDLTAYDYVVEIHFNASPVGSKDISGNGACKGFMIYINYYKSAADRVIDRNILSSITGIGYKQAWEGLVTSTTLTNAKVCQEQGVNYSLLETAFVDDADDMAFYVRNKEKMASAIASAIEKSL